MVEDRVSRVEERGQSARQRTGGQQGGEKGIRVEDKSQQGNEQNSVGLCIGGQQCSVQEVLRAEDRGEQGRGQRRAEQRTVLLTPLLLNHVL